MERTMGPMAEEEIILVDEDDNPLGFETKLEAHRDGGKLHRAFSIFIFDSAGRMLLQRRARTKYHFGGLWANACCGHPRKDETLTDAANRRLGEEFGFQAQIEEAFTFIYRATDQNSGLTEYEFDHVFLGSFDGKPHPNPDEIGEWKWVKAADLVADLERNPQDYTPWFRISAARAIEHHRSWTDTDTRSG